MPIYTKLIGIIITVAIIIAAVFIYGRVEYDRGVSDTKLAMQSKVAKVAVTSGKITTQIETKYIDRVQVIHDKGKQIIQKVPIYVTSKDNYGCVINTGFVRLWNNANGMQVPDPTTFINETTSDVVLSDIATQHAREAEIAHKTEEQLISLQKWVAKQQAAYRNDDGRK